MKTKLLPATRIEASLRREVERALEEGETLSSFIESAVRRQLEVRESQRAFLERGLLAEAGAEKANSWLEADDVLADIDAACEALSTPRRRAR